MRKIMCLSALTLAGVMTIGMQGALAGDNEPYRITLLDFTYSETKVSSGNKVCVGNTLNITLGLPFIRISVDHGTAYEIAGKNKADFSSMEEALKTSVSLL